MGDTEDLIPMSYEQSHISDLRPTPTQNICNEFVSLLLLYVVQLSHYYLMCDSNLFGFLIISLLSVSLFHIRGLSNTVNPQT